jgi:osmotically-inducible protein OsmY
MLFGLSSVEFGSAGPGFTFDCDGGFLTNSVLCALANASDINAADITVSSSDGWVVLEGSAPRKRDIERAEQIAISIVGGSVRNRIWQQGK